MIVVIDYREKELYAKCLSLLEKINLRDKIALVIENLPIGDIILKDDNGNEKVIIERKNINDLASSISDGRYKEQSLRLQNTTIPNHNIIYMIEGNLEIYKPKWSRIDKTSLYSSLVTMNYYKGFSIMKTQDINETMEYILRIADKMNREKKKDSYYSDISFNKYNNSKYCDVVKKVKKENIQPENIGEIILSQIPGVSSTTSKLIMDHFGSLYNLLIELKKNQKILNNLTFKFDNNTERRISSTSIRNIIKYLLYQKDNVININTEL